MIRQLIDHPFHVVRFILFLTFFGHGLVSFELSPSFNLHFKLVDSINVFDWDIPTILKFQGLFDITIALCFLFGFQIRAVAGIAIFYLISVGITAWIFYTQETGNLFGLAEFMRRIPWILFSTFLLLGTFDKKPRFHLIRIGISAAFLAHGIASLGLLGMKGAHIDLARIIIPMEYAELFVFYSGFSDLIMGSLLLLGLFCRYVAPIAALWILAIVILSFVFAIPDGIFRSGFLVAILYCVIDRRVDEPGIRQLFK